MTDSEPAPKGIVKSIKRILQPEKRIEYKSGGQELEPESVVTAKNILNETKFSEVASFWSGLPANREYFDGSELKKVYDKVKNEEGTGAAYSFANMVVDMPSLAPSNLIRAFLSLAGNNWIYDPRFSERILAGNTDIRPVKRENEFVKSEEAIAEGFFGRVAATIPKEDETETIKNEFKDILDEELKAITASREVIDLAPQK